MSDYIVDRMEEGDLSAIQRYIDGLKSINEYIYEDNESCLTLIHLAAGLNSRYRETVIEFLIKSRVDVNCPGKSDNVENVRPLHIASMWGYDKTITLLLLHGADASLRDKEGLSPVDYSSIFDNYLCISILLRYGCLNSTAAAWSAIMDSSLGDKNDETSFDEGDEREQNFNRSIDVDGDDRPCAYSRSSIGRITDGGRLNISDRDDDQSICRIVRQRLNRLSIDRYDRPGTSQSLSDKIDRAARLSGASHSSVKDDKATEVKEILDEAKKVRFTIEKSGNQHLNNEERPFQGLNEEDILKNYEMGNSCLRHELLIRGYKPGPITETTKLLYAKLLARLMKNDKPLVYTQKTETTSEANGFSYELNCILTGTFSIKQALDLEREFMQISGSTDYHGPKQFFNYILIDPRISLNLPEQVMELMSDSDTSESRLSPIVQCNDKNMNVNGNRNGYGNGNKDHDKNNNRNSMAKLNRKFNPELFTRFLQSIFYIGKGQKKRDLMHLYDALADRDSITKKKIDRIRAIWNDGYGVVSLHLFHNITSKEALTREAMMIETLGLSNLTNLVKGTIQFRLGWNEHKRKLLGALLLHRAYTQLLNEGERQLYRQDLKYNSKDSL